MTARAPQPGRQPSQAAVWRSSVRHGGTLTPCESSKAQLSKGRSSSVTGRFLKVPRSPSSSPAETARSAFHLSFSENWKTRWMRRIGMTASPRKSSSLNCGSTADLASRRQSRASRPTRDPSSSRVVKSEPLVRARRGRRGPEGRSRTAGRVPRLGNAGPECQGSRNQAVVARARRVSRLLSSERAAASAWAEHLAATVHRVRRQPSQGSPAASCRSPSRSLRSTKHRFVVHFDNTTTWCHTANGVKATLLVRRRIEYADNRFAEVVVWILDRPLPGSKHLYKYRLAYVVDEVCVLRFDNEAGKGDHRHMGDQEFDYLFRSIEALLSDFERNVRRLNDEDGNT